MLAATNMMAGVLKEKALENIDDKVKKRGSCYHFWRTFFRKFKNICKKISVGKY